MASERAQIIHLQISKYAIVLLATMTKNFKIIKEKIAQFFCRIFIWAINVLISKRRLKASTPEHCNKHAGIACALCSPIAHVRAGNLLHSCNIKQPKSSQPFLSPSSWPSSSSSHSWDKSPDGDVLGTESGVHMCSNQYTQPWKGKKPCIPKQSLQGRVHMAKKRDIPPPISILIKDRLDYKVPFPLSRQNDGQGKRLKPGENEVEHCEYLEIIRENGRLIINLVTVNYSISSNNTWDEDEEVEEPGKDGTSDPFGNV